MGRLTTILLILTAGVTTINIDHLKEPPKPDKSIQNLIYQLGADTFGERQAAHNQLIKIGYPAISALEDAMEKTDDLERSMRAEAIWCSYFDTSDLIKKECYFGIYDMSNSIRFPDGIQKDKRDIGLEYYIKARKIYNDQIGEYIQKTGGSVPVSTVGDGELRHQSVETLALQQFIFDQMHSGMDRKDAILLLKETEHNYMYGVHLPDPEEPAKPSTGNSEGYDNYNCYNTKVPPPWDELKSAPPTNPIP